MERIVIEITSDIHPKFEKGDRAFLEGYEGSAFIASNSKYRKQPIKKSEFKELKPMKYEIGQEIIVDRAKATPFKRGEVVKIFDIDELNRHYILFRDNMGWAFEEYELKLP